MTGVESIKTASMPFFQAVCVQTRIDLCHLKGIFIFCVTGTEPGLRETLIWHNSKELQKEKII